MLDPTSAFSICADTDLALERHRAAKGAPGIRYRERAHGALLFSAITVTREGETRLGKPRGRYLSLHFPPLITWSEETEEALVTALAAALAFFLLPAKRILVAGLGNRRLTPDAFGPLTADGVSVSAALPESLLSLGISPPVRVAATVPDVTAHTGIESAALVGAAARISGADAVLAVDALAAGERERLLSVFEIADSGTVPGSGMKRGRSALTADALGLPVIALGMPTVVRADAAHFLVPQGLEEGVTALSSATARAIDLALGFSPPTLPFSLSSLFSEEKT